MRHAIENFTLWDYLKQQNKKIIVYGMGNGGLKLVDACNQHSIEIADFFASDNFARGQFFCGKRVKTFDEIKSEYNDFIILLAFGVDKQSEIERLFNISKKYEMYAPDLPLFGKKLFDLQYLNINYDKILKAYNMLEDAWSKKAFVDIINYKISGKIEYLINSTTPKSEIYNIIKYNKNEIFVDLGAYNGDTIAEFISQTNGEYNKIFAFEPDSKNYIKLKKYVNNNQIKNIHCFKIAAWDKQEDLFFDNSGSRNSNINCKCTTKIMANSVDNLKIKPTTIKMDVEGSEYQAIIGSGKTIMQNKPKLMISAYHRTEDLFLLPELIKKINPEYKIYFRHHPYIPAWENCYYFI